MKHKNNKTKNKFKYKTKYGGASTQYNSQPGNVTSNPLQGSALASSVGGTPTKNPAPNIGTNENTEVFVKQKPLGFIGKIIKFVKDAKDTFISIAAIIAFIILVLVIYVVYQLFTALFSVVNFVISALNAIAKLFISIGKKFGVKSKAKLITPIPKTLYDLIMRSIPPLPPIF